MIVQLGEQVMGKNGKLGEIEGFRIDPNSQTADQMVIKHGVLGHDGRLTVLGHVTGVETGVVYVDLAREDLERMEQYSRSGYNSASADRKGPFPSTQQGYEGLGYGIDKDMTMSARVDRADRPVNETHAMPPEYPQGTDVTPEDKQPTIISQGSPVLDRNGEKVGEVQSLAVDTATGQATRVTLRHGGILSPSEVELPLEWISEFGFKGIVLNVDKDQVKQAKR